MRVIRRVKMIEQILDSNHLNPPKFNIFPFAVFLTWPAEFDWLVQSGQYQKENSYYGCCGEKSPLCFISNMAIRSRIFQGKHLYTNTGMHWIKWHQDLILHWFCCLCSHYKLYLQGEGWYVLHFETLPAVSCSLSAFAAVTSRLFFIIQA